MEIVSIVASLRPDSWNHKLSNIAARLLRERGATVAAASLSDLPLFNGDLDGGEFPPPVALCGTPCTALTAS